MTDEPIPSDPLVRTALQLLPVPDHEPGFWERLEVALDAEPAPKPAPAKEPAAVRDDRRVVVGGPAEVVDLRPAPVPGVVPAAMRRPSNLVLSALAVAAAVVVVLAGTSLVRSRTGDDDPAGDEQAAETTAEAEAGGEEAASGASTSISTLRAPDDDPAAAAVVEWVNALAAGEVEQAWDALGPASQEHWGSEAAFAAERSALAEGYGAWSAGTPDHVLVTPLDGDELVVVSLVGTVEQEGVRVPRADAFVVRLDGDEPRLEVYGGGLEVVVPEPSDDGAARPTVGVDEELVIVVPEGADAPVLRIDDGEPVTCGEAPGTELTELEGSSGRRCGYAPTGGLEAGERVLTVAYGGGDGQPVAARSVRFRAA